MTTQLRAEVAPGVFKAVHSCTAAEKAAAREINAEKIRLTERWTQLLDELGETWIPQTPFVMRMGVGDVPAEMPLHEFRDEVAKLETMLDMKRKGTGSNN